MTKSLFKSIPNGRFHDEVSRQIAHLIVRSDLLPNSLLPSESELVDQFGVSRVVVREALRSLEQRRFIEMRQGKRTVVLPEQEWNVLDDMVLQVYRDERQIDPLIEDFLWVRCKLEPEIAAEAARHVDASLVADLSDLLERMEEHLDDPTLFCEWDMEFHNRLAMATKNRVLYQLTTIVGSLFNRNRDLTFDINDAMAGAFEWHRRIYEKVTAGDPEGAYQAMKEHLEWTSKRIRASLKPDLIP